MTKSTSFVIRESSTGKSTTLFMCWVLGCIYSVTHSQTIKSPANEHTNSKFSIMWLKRFSFAFYCLPSTQCSLQTDKTLCGLFVRSLKALFVYTPRFVCCFYQLRKWFWVQVFAVSIWLIVKMCGMPFFIIFSKIKCNFLVFAIVSWATKQWNCASSKLWLNWNGLNEVKSIKTSIFLKHS